MNSVLKNLAVLWLACALYPHAKAGFALLWHDLFIGILP